MQELPDGAADALLKRGQYDAPGDPVAARRACSAAAAAAGCAARIGSAWRNG